MILKNILVRLHIFIGLFIGPFIFIAALSGALYAFTYAVENWVYQDILTSKEEITFTTLAEQIAAANKLVGKTDEFYSIRPSFISGKNSRVLYLNKSLEASQFRTVFINPHNLEIKADIITYGSGGAMPARMWVDFFHRDLLLGKLGRFYSELAASWMWIAGISGIILLMIRKKKTGNHYQLLLNKHSSIGLFSFIALIALSITGLTWSEWAGENITKIRSEFKWSTPSLKPMLVTNISNHYKLETFDEVVAIARKNGIDSPMIEIKPPTKKNFSWQVAEIDRHYPTSIDAISIDPEKLEIKDKIEFKNFPIMAKLTRWGIDIHTGTLFGLINQILIGLMSLGICALVITGLMLWLRSHGFNFRNTLLQELKNTPRNKLLIISIFIIPILIFIPLILLSLIVFVPIEEYLARRNIR